MWDPQAYQQASQLFLRLLGVVYILVWWPYLFQIKGLLGEHGILPISQYLGLIKQHYGKPAYRLVPSLFWFNSSDKALLALVWAGLFCALLLVLGVWIPLMLLLLYVLYLSLVSTGQDFLSFGWDVLLLEITVNAFLLSLTTTPSLLVWISLNLVLFRLHFQGGAVKWQSRDPNWRNFTAVAYHYLSQPLPNLWAWYLHKLPIWVHKISCVIMLVIEMGVPFLIFGNAEMRLVAWVLIVGLQVAFWATGNFSYLNHMTVALATVLVADKFMPQIFGSVALENVSEPVVLQIFLYVAGAILIVLQLLNLYENLWHKVIPFVRPIERYIAPFHLANRYGLFAVMTTKRYEIVVEGSDDGVIWKEYLFRYKPSELNRYPKRVSPYHPRLDWQAWFLPFESFNEQIWFHNFLIKLLQGEKTVISLLRECPFPDHPPKYIRAIAYDYKFTSLEEKRQTGQWWTRRLVGAFSPTFRL